MRDGDPMYLVESYDASDEPDDRRFVNQGQYASAADALAAARQLIEANLVLALSAGMSAADAFEQWRRSGDVPRIVARGGAAPVQFDPFAFAQARAQELRQRA